MAAEDLPVIAAMLLVVGLGMLIISFIGDTFASEVVLQPGVNQSSYAVNVFNSIDGLTDKFDMLFLGTFIGFILGMIILSWFVPTHPFFFLAYLIVLIISTILSSVLANVWESISTVTAFASTLPSLPITNHVLNNLPLYVAIIGFVGMTVMFAKPYIQEQ